MTIVDLFLIALLLAAVSGGYRMGLLMRVGSWAGLVAGIAVSIVVVGPVVGLFEGSSEFVRLIVALAVVLGLASVGQGIGASIGARLRFAIGRGPVRTVDRMGGAVAGAVGVLVVVWLLLPTLGLIPGTVAQAARNSSIVAFVDENSPEPPLAARELSRRVSDFEFPPVFIGMQPAPEVGPPPSALPISADVVNLVSPSTVNVEGLGCGGIKEGSGFVVERDLVATNAHVVAGTATVSVRLTDGSTREGTVVTFDEDRDLALIQVPGLERPPITIDDAVVGEGVAAFGHPGGQDQLRVAPVSVEDQIEAVGRDIYNRGRVRRDVLVLAAELRQGDSGAAVIDADANVIGVVFAVAPDQSATAYALAASELREVLGQPRDAGVGTGGCT